MVARGAVGNVRHSLTYRDRLLLLPCLRPTRCGCCGCCVCLVSGAATDLAKSEYLAALVSSPICWYIVARLPYGTASVVLARTPCSTAASTMPTPVCVRSIARVWLPNCQ